MDSATCNVIYVDRNVCDDAQLSSRSATSDVDAALGQSGQLRANLSLLLDAFGDGTSWAQFYRLNQTC